MPGAGPEISLPLAAENRTTLFDLGTALAMTKGLIPGGSTERPPWPEKQESTKARTSLALLCSRDPNTVASGRAESLMALASAS